MDLKELTYIVMLADEGSISRAADKLYMAQSSLSQFLQQYEKELGTPLFLRTSKGIKPTEGGAGFIDSAREILLRYREAENQLWDSVNLQGGMVTFGISSFRGSAMLPRILKKFYEKYPKVKVAIVEANSMALEEKLMNAEIDLAVVALPLTKLKGSVEPIKQDEILLVAHKGHPILAHTRPQEGKLYDYLELADAAGFDFILSDYDTMLGKIGRQLFADAGIPLHAIHTNITAPLAAGMAKAGLGLAFTYASCADQNEECRYLSLGKDGVFLSLMLAYSPFEYRSKASIALGQIVKEYMI